jgi:hypothetical protein
MTTFASVRKQTNGGRPKPKNYKLLIFRMDDVITYPDRQDDGVIISEDLILAATKNCIELEATADTIALKVVSEGETDNKGFIVTLTFNRPGTSDKEWEEFANKNVNEELGAILRYCDSNRKPKILGTLCNPLVMDVETTDDKEADVNAVTLATKIRGDRPAFYEGVIPAIDSVSDVEITSLYEKIAYYEGLISAIDSVSDSGSGKV